MKTLPPLKCAAAEAIAKASFDALKSLYTLPPAPGQPVYRFVRVETTAPKAGDGK